MTNLPKKKYWVGKIQDKQETTIQFRKGWNECHDQLTRLIESGELCVVPERDDLQTFIDEYVSKTNHYPDARAIIEMLKSRRG